MGCSLDNLAFKTAQEALQHYNGKKHRNKMERHLKNVAQESLAIHVKGKNYTHLPLTSPATETNVG